MLIILILIIVVVIVIVIVIVIIITIFIVSKLVINYTEWSTIQAVVMQKISKVDNCKLQGQFEITGTLAP